MRTSSQATTVRGVAWRSETYVYVRWGWLAFLASQMLLSYVFLFITVAWTRRIGAPALKSSALATLSVLNEDVLSRLGSFRHLSDLEVRAKDTHVQLVENKLTLTGRRP